MIDAALSLAHSVQSNRGVFAVLLGSGLSSSAGIPTGWQVTLDLVRAVAAMEQADPGDDPAAWFLRTRGVEPDYSNLLDALAKSPAERRAILHKFFEPTEEEREQGLKAPTPAHRAIAALAAKGYVKVIITTNFDRLMELALQDAGVTPTVLSSVDAIKGAAPLVHQACVVIKVHGDYLDDRIRNTQGELAAYEPELDAYLDRVFDEFGLIVCGWSGQWDPALRAALLRAPSRRYTLYWASMRPPVGQAASLVQARAGQTIAIDGADAFFQGLAQTVQSLEDIARPAPLSVSAAVASVKRFVADPLHRVRLSDLLADEVARLNASFAETLSPNARAYDNEAVKRRFAAYEGLTETLRAMLFHSARWARPEHDALVLRTISDLSSPTDRNGLVAWLDLQAYPVCLAFYAACLGAEAGQNYRLMRQLFAMRYRFQRRDRIAVPELCSFYVAHDLAKILRPRFYVPLSEHLATVFEPLLATVSRDPTELFDRVEFFTALARLDQEDDPTKVRGIPWGRYAFQHDDDGLYPRVFVEIERQGEDWPPLREGLFKGPAARLASLKEALLARFSASGFH